MEKQKLCSHCKGTGSKDGKMKKCSTCKGTGIYDFRRGLNSSNRNWIWIDENVINM